MVIPYYLLVDVCASEIQAEHKLKSGVQYLIADPMSHLMYTQKGDKLLYKNRLMQTANIISTLARWLHCNP